MTKSRNKSSKTQSSDQKLNIINAKAAGIDLGAREHWVCVPQELSQENIRSFGCTTPDLLLLADWLEPTFRTSSYTFTYFYIPQDVLTKNLHCRNYY
ncbi:hypothetical protein H0902_02045 [Microcystis aeruginosa BLCCF108]|uniref:Transposase n=1 Tax=Microcystis aeruginosa BLCC-F108 TaxID=2755317 RepID=A0A841UN63_MICAE|nr:MULTISPECIES: hypothetical protein [Microcystis]MBC1189667.1 hypothetical protein [Microcystis aeruginosa BLCC-F108]MCA2591229.1 hypothetical protein [Microcystis sp. M31BS1]